MESIIFILIGAGIFAFNRYLREDNGQICPKCGKKAIRTGKMIERGTGRAVWGYKCSCGEFWYGK